VRQRISVEQLKELTPEQQEKLRAWWQFEYGDLFYDRELADIYVAFKCHDDDYYSSIPDENCLPLLSIGQCIAILEDNNFEWWGIICETDWIGGLFKNFDLKDKELIDFLFESVKSIL